MLLVLRGVSFQIPRSLAKSFFSSIVVCPRLAQKKAKPKHFSNNARSHYIYMFQGWESNCSSNVASFLGARGEDLMGEVIL